MIHPVVDATGGAATRGRPGTDSGWGYTTIATGLRNIMRHYYVMTVSDQRSLIASILLSHVDT
jgi:hypothetical protein